MRIDRIQGIIFNDRVPSLVKPTLEVPEPLKPMNRLSRRASVISKIKDVVPASLAHLKLHRHADDSTTKLSIEETLDLLDRLKDQ